LPFKNDFKKKQARNDTLHPLALSIWFRERSPW